MAHFVLKTHLDKTKGLFEDYFWNIVVLENQFYIHMEHRPPFCATMGTRVHIVDHLMTNAKVFW